MLRSTTCKRLQVLASPPRSAPAFIATMLIATLIGLWSLPAQCEEESTAKQPPNLVLIFIDDK